MDEELIKLAVTTLSKEFAPGIPKNRPKLVPPATKTPSIWNIGIQKHTTPRPNGQRRVHFDLRLNPQGSTHAYSWAIPKARLPNPGERLLAVETFTHKADYMPFKGVIQEGYGKGLVERHLLDKAEILSSEPGKIVFNLYHKKRPQEYALIKTNGDNWVIVNRSKIPEDIDKIKERGKYITKLESNVTIGKDIVAAMPKMDGAFAAIRIGEKNIRLYSHRTPKKGKVIEYTHKVPKIGLLKAPIGLKDTILRSELIAEKNGVIAGANDVAGILNSRVLKSRQKQDELGELKPWVFDIVKYKGKDLEGVPYEERRKILKKVLKKLPGIKEMPMETNHQKMQNLLQRIKYGNDPRTKEGVVLVDDKGNFTKVKFRNEHDVYIKGFTKGTGKYEKSGVGAIQYGFTPLGPVAGKVGTGLSDKLRADMKRHPNKFKGKVIKVKADQVYKDKQGNPKSLRAPSFIDFHPEKNIY